MGQQQISRPSVELAVSQILFVLCGFCQLEFEEVTENLRFRPTGLIFFFFLFLFSNLRTSDFLKRICNLKHTQLSGGCLPGMHKALF